MKQCEEKKKRFENVLEKRDKEIENIQEINNMMESKLEALDANFE